MPLRKIRAYKGHYYHVFNRGARKLAIYHNEKSYHFFLTLVAVYSDKYNITIIAICLMPNHFHLLIRVEPGGDLARFVKMVCGEFSRRMNKFQRRSGTLFEGRFKCKYVVDALYFSELCRYIHLNPVKAALVDSPHSWEFSNFQECMGERQYIIGDHGIVTDMFGGRGRYSEYVQDGIADHVIRHRQLLEDLADMQLI